MIDDFEKVKAQLKELAPIINAFKAESVQLRVIELLLGTASGDAESAEEDPGKTATTPTPTKRKRKRKTTAPKESTANTPDTKKKSSSRGGTGAYAAVSALYDNGFFKSSQTIRSVIAHCGTSKGHHFKANQISPPLLRMLRDGKLTRNKNSDNQYEYSEA